MVAEMLNAYFVETVGEITTLQILVQLSQRYNIVPTQYSCYLFLKMKQNVLLKKITGKFSAGYDEIPKYVVKECAKFVKGPLAHIYNILINSDTFAEKFKVARVSPCIRKEIFIV